MTTEVQQSEAISKHNGWLAYLISASSLLTIILQSLRHIELVFPATLCRCCLGSSIGASLGSGCRGLLGTLLYSAFAVLHQACNVRHLTCRDPPPDTAKSSELSESGLPQQQRCNSLPAPCSAAALHRNL